MKKHKPSINQPTPNTSPQTVLTISKSPNNQIQPNKINNMMNVLALGLLLTSLVTSSFLSPNPQNKHDPNKENVIVKEGHRVVVVEYEKGDDGNTKVLISPQDSAHVADNEDGYVSRAKEGVEQVEESTVRGFNPREIVCDAYGKCKHKIASVIGKGKENVESLEENSENVAGNVKDSASKVKDIVSDMTKETKENVKGVSSKTKEKFVEKTGEMKGKVSDAIDSTMKLKENVESEGRRKMEGVKEKVREKAENVEEMVEDASDRMGQGASEVKTEAKKELSEILRHGREVLYDVFSYVVTPVRDSVSGVLHLMGFSAAYGLCLWITFASSYVLAGALPRHQFAVVQSKIYPVYFKAMAYSIGLALLGHLLGSKRFSLFNAGSFQGFNLLASLGMVLANLMYLEPRATKVLFERLKKEKEEGLMSKESHMTDSSVGVRTVDSSSLGETAGRVTSITQEKAKEGEAAKSELLRLSEILKRLNSYSSFLNVLTLMSLTGHLVHLGQRMHTSCS